MPNVDPTAELHAGFSDPNAVAPPWSDVVAVLVESEMFWLSTVRRDGRPQDDVDRRRAHGSSVPVRQQDG